MFLLQNPRINRKAGRRFTRFRRFFLLKTLGKANLVQFHIVPGTALLLLVSRGYVPPLGFPSDYTMLLDQRLDFLFSFKIYVLWFSVFLFCCSVFQGFNLFVNGTQKFENANTVYDQFRRDFDEQSLLLFT
jgi:hypothetical protein